MVILVGPRQVGKTTLSRAVLRTVGGEYLNYDHPDDRRKFLSLRFNEEAPLVVLDEIHKFSKWKNHVKGAFDKNRDRQTYLITGSARLDLIRKAGESLAGRFFLHRLHPLSVKELLTRQDAAESVEQLLKRGGFPEPYFVGDSAHGDDEAARWRAGHVDRIIREDLGAVGSVKDVALLETLIELLSERVGSTLSYASLAEELRVAPKTVKAWIDLLEKLWVIFLVRPYTRSSVRSLQKEPKAYFFDTGRVVKEGGARLENLVACHLIKRNHFLEDSFGKKMALHFLRDKEKREVDFLTVCDRKPEYLIEVKKSDENLSRPLLYYHDRIPGVKALQVIHRLRHPETINGVRKIGVAEFLASLEA